MKIVFIIIFTLCLIPAAGAGAETTVPGSRGGSVQIRCSYTAGYETNRKYLCRGFCFPGLWVAKDIPVESGSDPEDKRFSLYDNTADKVFIITITDLRAEDAGTYWCGIKRAILEFDLYTEVKLRVKTDDPASSTLSSSTRFPSTHAVGSTVPAESTPFTSTSFLLPVNHVPLFSIHTVQNGSHQTKASPSSPGGGSLTKTGKALTEKRSTIIMVLVIVALLLIGLVLLIVFLKKRRRKRHGVSPPCVSEGIEDTGRCPEVFYSDLEPPTCDSDAYENVFALAQLEAAPCDSAHAAADRPSDSPDEDFYSTAQLPADPSAPSEKPDEGPIYTQVKFNVDHPTDFKREDDSCEYSIVTEIYAKPHK